MPVFMLAGQSNMLGWSVGKPSPDEPQLPGVWTFGITDTKHCNSVHLRQLPGRKGVPACDRACESWAPYQPMQQQMGLCGKAVVDKAVVGGPGPELGFARVMHDGLPAILPGSRGNRSFGILKLAIGASSMIDWEPSNDNGTRLWNTVEMVVRRALRGDFYVPVPATSPDASFRPAGPPSGTNLTSQCVRVQGLAWMQGEADALSVPVADKWEERFRHLVSRVRALVGSPQLPVVVARILTSNQARFRPGGVIVRERQLHMASSSPFFDWVDTDDLPINSRATTSRGVLHLNLQGVISLGARLGAAMLRLLARRTGFTPPANCSRVALPMCYEDDGSRCALEALPVAAARNAVGAWWWEEASIGLIYVDVRVGGANVSSMLRPNIRQIQRIAPTLPITLWLGPHTGVPQGVLDSLGRKGQRRMLPGHLNGMSGRAYAVLHSPFRYTLNLDSDSWPCPRALDLVRSVLGSADIVWTRAPRFPCGGVHGGGCYKYVTPAITPLLDEYSSFAERNIATISVFRNSSAVQAWLRDVMAIYEAQNKRLALFKGSDQPAWREGFFLHRHTLTERLLPREVACRRHNIFHNDSACQCLCDCSSCMVPARANPTANRTALSACRQIMLLLPTFRATY